MTIPETIERKTCRVCDSPDLEFLYSLGDLYVSDFVKLEDVHDGIKAPVTLELCKNQNCSLVQLKHTAPQEILYSRKYWYKSGITETMRDALRDVVTQAERLASLKPGDIVLDIGSNDGTLLRCYPKHVIRIGFEPATNLAEEGKEGVSIFVNDFWSQEKYRDVVYGKAKVITALGMFYDLEDPNTFIRDVKACLAQDGIFIAQLMCLRNMMDLCDVGNLAHEHLEFYSLKSLKYLLENNGLQVFRTETNSVNGQSYRFYVRHTPIGSGNWFCCPVFERLYHQESIDRLDTGYPHVRFHREMCDRRDKVADFVRKVVGQGKVVDVYGASTKGNTILQWYGLDYRFIRRAVDRSEHKDGLYTIGTGIPIVWDQSPNLSAVPLPDYYLVLPYAFIDEFERRETAFLANGGKFIVPLPVPVLIGHGERWKTVTRIEDAFNE